MKQASSDAPALTLRLCTVGAAFVLSCLPYEEIKDGLTQLLIPHVAKLNQVIYKYLTSHTFIFSS